MHHRLVTLRQVNENVRNALLRFRPETQHCSAIAPGDFSSLLRELLRASECLHCVDANPDSNHAALDQNARAFAHELREYRANLEKLKHILPDLQIRLLAEKARLQNAQSHVNAASAWAGASKGTVGK